MRWLISCLILVGVFYSCRAHAELPITPEGVLPYLEAVYSSGDIEAYADLLAADFKFVLEDMKASWDKAADIKGTQALRNRQRPNQFHEGSGSETRATTWDVDH